MLEDVFYTDYNGRVVIDEDILLVAAWDEYIKDTGADSETIYLNDDKEFFENTFQNKYDAALAVSLSNKWQWADKFVYVSREGFLTSFSHWDDENSPIAIDKIDINNLINSLKK